MYPKQLKPDFQQVIHKEHFFLMFLTLLISQLKGPGQPSTIKEIDVFLVRNGSLVETADLNLAISS